MPLCKGKTVLCTLAAFRRQILQHNVRCYSSPRDTLGSVGMMSRGHVSDLDLDGQEWRSSQEIINLNQDFLMIKGFNNQGFILNNGIRVLGSVAMFPKTILHWNVYSPQEITEESLSLFVNLQPSLDMLVLGIGDEGSQVDLKVINYLKKKRIGVEFTTTYRAVPLYNFLVSEGRYVAGAFIPGEEVPSMRARVMLENVDNAEDVDGQINQKLEAVEMNIKNLTSDSILQGRLEKDKTDLEQRKAIMEERKQTLRDRKKQHRIEGEKNTSDKDKDKTDEDR
ncbi:uncharacterized protein LOC106162088 [Lingula anatina]|uniref:Uncharacterized protein LOC106162088 n=1 Tax=Lingula anatina TaxID=7574 RepID=A0A1S3I8U4_LINAN|nr:uncharacterized protein LOC106162088 [Lingula anatina]|eukprot:XP_013394672.1 uncharacterized protein LOC106162088 [Lingula anatina]